VASGFTSPPKEGQLQITIAIKIPLPSVRSEPTNFGSYGKHAIHYITEESGLLKASLNKLQINNELKEAVMV
jgi:hypothetical protein